jgi:hypothetical protein
LQIAICCDLNESIDQHEGALTPIFHEVRCARPALASDFEKITRAGFIFSPNFSSLRAHDALYLWRLVNWVYAETVTIGLTKGQPPYFVRSKTD